MKTTTVKEKMQKSGNLTGICKELFLLVKNNPGSTLGELASLYTGKRPRGELSKRMSDLQRWGIVKKDGARKCAYSGRISSVWVVASVAAERPRKTKKSTKNVQPTTTAGDVTEQNEVESKVPGESRQNTISLEEQKKQANDLNVDVRVLLAKNPKLPLLLQEQLANDQDAKVRAFLAENPNLHPSLQEKLANDQGKYVQRYLAGNPNLHPSVQKKFANDPDVQDEHVRRYLACNLNLQPSVQEKLANDSDVYVRAFLAQNPNLQPYVQEKLVNDPDTYVRLFLAADPNLHPSLQGRLVNDPNSSVRLYLANNPGLHPSLLEKLANDPEKYIRAFVAKKLGLDLSVNLNLPSKDNFQQTTEKPQTIAIEQTDQPSQPQSETLAPVPAPTDGEVTAKGLEAQESKAFMQKLKAFLGFKTTT